MKAIADIPRERKKNTELRREMNVLKVSTIPMFRKKRTLLETTGRDNYNIEY